MRQFTKDRIMDKKEVDLVCDIAELISLCEVDQGDRDVLQCVTSAVAQHMHTDVCSIYIYDEEDRVLNLRATYGLRQEAVGTVKLALGEGITGSAVRELRPICVGSASTSPAYRHFIGIDEEKYEAFLAVPILRGLRRIGALVVQSRVANSYSQNDIKVLRAIAAQLATMIENVQLLTEVRSGRMGMARTAAEPEAPVVREKMLRGRSASPGIAKGRALIMSESQHLSCDFPDPATPPHTIEDFDCALKATEQQIDQLQRQTGSELADVAVLIFSAHLLILQDEQFSGRIAKMIREGEAPEKAVSFVVNEYVEIFSKSQVPQIREKVLDVRDLGNRLLRNLQNATDDVSDYQGQIIIAHELLPSDILKLSAENVEGFVVSSGVTSHNAIICRSLSIPMVALSRELADQIVDGEEVLLDAEQGIIYLQPDQKVMDKFTELDAAWKAMHNADDVKEISRTADGELVHILANVNLLSDLRPAREFKAEGVGLYRSEFPFIVRNDFPTEEEQYVIYKKLVDNMDGLPVTFRTLDIGGDKMLSYYSNVNEANPFLGMRAIRFSLQNRDIFAKQLRAFLRAGADAETRIMFPLISSLDDFLAAREIAHECMDELEFEGVPFNAKTRFGVMIELPSAVEVIDELAQEADFLSIGSNDLIQYMLAVDRTNEQVSNLYLPYHPAVLRVIKRVVAAALRHEKDVSLCGDLAVDPHMLPFLMGVGLRKFSIDIHNALTLQQQVGKLSVEHCQSVANTMLSFGRIKDVEEYLDIAPE